MATNTIINSNKPIQAALGGTSASTFTSNSILTGNGTSAIQTISTGNSGQLLLGKTSNPAAFATATSSKGSVVYTTGSHSLNLDLLDYATGTFVPVLTFAGGTTGITYSTQTAEYVRISNMAFINIRVVLTSKGSSTGSMTLTGLPYTPNTNASQLNISAQNITYTGQLVATGNNAGTDLLIQAIVSGGSVTTITNTGFANNSSFTITGVYFI